MEVFFLVAGIHLLAVMSPGPDFAMVLRNSLIYSRRTGVLAAVGLGLGISLHITYSLLGIGLVISQSVVLFNIIKWIGAAYLIYIGIKSLRSRAVTAGNEPGEYSHNKDISALGAIRMGFLTNALNPKATMFFLALFTQVIDPTTSLILKLAYGIEMSVATFLWFSFVAVLLTQKRPQRLFKKFKHRIEQVFGGVLIALGIKVALTSK